MGVLTACEPRQDIITGTFNPEIFTASLSEVISFYRQGTVSLHSLYTDAHRFFGEATYPTDGMKSVLGDVFARIAGDNSVPAIHRLETAFGGGKTHTLIACTHLAFKGNELIDVAGDLVNPANLQSPGSIHVVGVAGDGIPVHQPQGAELIPYTLWGEIAFQVGGESLYRQIGDIATSMAAPGENYFATVFQEKKVLVMLDELAQYAARLEAARPDGADQLAAFLMGLHGYARRNPGIAILLTLASASDAFANQTSQLGKMLAKVTGMEIDSDGVLAISQKATKGVASVIARDATAVVPVQAAEISRVLAKRLFTRIDDGVARSAAGEYMELYAKNQSLLPGHATREEYRERMISHYPFHPTLIDFLNHKLAASEDFQGTRGVLRVLTLAVRNLWAKQVDVPMIHTCHFNLREARTITELINRTGSAGLYPVLNADVGGVDTSGVEGGKSNAELADLKNPHPNGWPLYEYTWKTIFLNSLVGQDQGIASNLFGLSEQDAMFATSFPGLTPSQVAEALKEIEHSAYYLRSSQGRYFASLDPSVNIVLARIRKSLQQQEIDERLNIYARKVVSKDNKTFVVEHDVTAPEHIPDNKGKPVLAIIALQADNLSVEQCVTTVGANAPRIQQNLVFLLVPDTAVISTSVEAMSLFGGAGLQAEQAKNKLRDMARTVLAMIKLKTNPDAHGITPRSLDDDGFRQRFTEREKALETAVTQSYRYLWFPSASGQIVRKEIRTAGGEGGVPVFEQIRKILLEEGELITAEHLGQSQLKGLSKLFFSAQRDTVSLQKLRKNFCCIRTWPILDSPDLLNQIVRAGVSRGLWCLFQMGNEENVKPEELYSQETGDLPLNLDLMRDYSLITTEGAKIRNWLGDGGPDLTKVKAWVAGVLNEQKDVQVAQVIDTVIERHGEIPRKMVIDTLSELIKTSKAVAHQGEVGQDTKPAQMYSGTAAVFYTPTEQDVLVTPAEAATRGWVTGEKERFSLSGQHGAQVVLPLLRRLGSLYNRGGKSNIDLLDMADLVLPGGGRLRLSLEKLTPADMKTLAELFEVLDGVATATAETTVYLEIDDVDDTCPFLQELRKGT
ncbi:ATP-binding protein [Desulfobulbus alkaliphilus]|uniref:ATP-binding protein n=1 Tax=Desulfobulbus alkaliphilus TaxID=869814 RepID=UPI0019641822|nr:DUF499 domain-containing protein [Desulfobulbus alkaliphilus]MBM9535982.1 ATP-binding protein [Desulfobulbus alkaliphilus]